MATDHKSLKQRMNAAKEDAKKDVKALPFLMPDLKGPDGNAFVLLSRADRLMKDANIPSQVQQEFSREAKSGDYENLLATIQKWFTIVIADIRYVPLSGDVKSLMSDGDSFETWEEYDAENSQAPADLDEKLAAYEDSSERSVQQAEIEARVNAQIRSELGLSDDDVVIVQIKRAKPKGD